MTSTVFLTIDQMHDVRYQTKNSTIKKEFTTEIKIAIDCVQNFPWGILQYAVVAACAQSSNKASNFTRGIYDPAE